MTEEDLLIHCLANSGMRFRINRCMLEGGLTVSDVARWLRRPVSCVRKWSEGTKPYKMNIKDIDDRLVKLERLVISLKGKPVVPPYISLKGRKAYLKELMNAARLDSEVPQ